MLEAFNEITDDDAEQYQVCGCLHSFLACFFFQVFDITAVLITVGAYYLISHEVELTKDISVPIAILVISFFFFFFGPVGLIMQRPGILVIYNVRLFLIVIFSLSWASYALIFQQGFVSYFVGSIWFSASLLYIWGIFTTAKALAYLEEHYRGYDDVDPDAKIRFEIALKNKLEELKQKELDEGTLMLSADEK